MKKSRRGKLISNGIILMEHEYATVVTFLKHGHDIELISPSNNPKTKMPDLLMKGLAWEMKSPQGKGRATIEHIFKKAAKQSENLIIDLRRLKRTQERNAIKILKNRFVQSKRVKRLYVVDRNGELIYMENVGSTHI